MTSHKDYLTAVDDLNNLSNHSDTDSFDFQAFGNAKKPRTNAEISAYKAIGVIVSQRQTARSALKPLQLVHLVPMESRPINGPTSATKHDIDEALLALAHAVDSLTIVAQNEFGRIVEENERSARSEAARVLVLNEAEARRQQIFNIRVLGFPLGRVLFFLKIYKL